MDLTDGKVLESISGESLYVTRAGEDIYINGVVIEGEAIQAGNSYVYVVPEVMEQQSEPVNVYVTTINVYAINQGNSAKSPLKDVTVVVNKAKKDSLGIIYTKGDSLGVWKTDEQGQVVVKHTEKLIAFNVYKADYSDKYDNYLLGGIGGRTVGIMLEIARHAVHYQHLRDIAGNDAVVVALFRKVRVIVIHAAVCQQQGTSHIVLDGTLLR